MPFKRTGLCALDQRICARMLDEDVPPKAIAKKLNTTVEVVKKFTTEALDKQAEKNKLKEAKVKKHQAETQKTAAALTSAAKDILNTPTVDDGDFK